MSNNNNYEDLYIGVKITVIRTVAQLKKSLKDLVSAMSQQLSCSNFLVGFDIGKRYKPEVSSYVPNFVAEKVAIVKLCHGETCLIINLLDLNGAACSLSNFLQLQGVTFVGVAIKHSIEALEKDYGITCRIAVDLCHMASGFKHYGSLGLINLMFISKVEYELMVKLMDNFEVVALTKWGSTTLTREQIKVAALGAIACFRIGKKLLNLSHFSLL